MINAAPLALPSYEVRNVTSYAGPNNSLVIFEIFFDRIGYDLYSDPSTVTKIICRFGHEWEITPATAAEINAAERRINA